MLLRSSSTPILGSLLSSSSSVHFSESPSSHQVHHHHQTFHSFACYFSDASDHNYPAAGGFRRTRSAGSLHSLLPDHHHSDDHLHNRHPPSLKCSSSSSSRRTNSFLESIPSFSIYNPTELKEEEGEEEEEVEEVKQENGDGLARSVTIGGSITEGFNFASGDQNNSSQESSQGIGVAPPLFLARGLGIDPVGSGLLTAGAGCGSCSGGAGGGGGKCSVLTGNNGEQSDVEMYYKRMVEENPNNALFLRNYAAFLYQAKGDPKRAEEYYSRAILADPSDGEILSQYAKLVWELHHDEERASSYFEQAVKAAPDDSHVLAAYAGFLWETEEDDGDGGTEGGQLQDFKAESLHNGAMASASA